MVAYICNPYTLEAEEEGLLQGRDYYKSAPWTHSEEDKVREMTH